MPPHLDARHRLHCKADAVGKKNADTIFIQDIIVTYTLSKAFMLDSGLLLTPNSHNSEQGAATLPPVDYGPYSFLHSTPTGSRVGRDYGLQGRGYLSSEHFELGPYVQYSRRDFAESGADEQNTQLGLAYWHSKHTFNVKLGYTRQERDGSVDRDQVVLQCQLFFC